MCKIDEIRQVFDVADAVREALLEAYPHRPKLEECCRQAASVIFGILLISEVDAFLKEGVVEINDSKLPHCWLELFFNGDEFILDVTLTQFEEQYIDQILPDTVFMIKEDAEMTYGYARGTEYDWQRDDCAPELWQAVLDTLRITRPVDEVLDEVSEIA